MLLIILFLVILVITSVLVSFSNEYSSCHIVGVISSIIGGISLFMGLLFIPLQRSSCYAYLQEIEEVRRIYENSEGKGEYDRAAILQKVIEINRELVSAQYYAKSSWFSIYYPSEILKTEPIK